MTGGSASCFGEQYRDLLLYLHQRLDEHNSNQKVHTAVQQYIIQYTIVCSHVASNSILFAESGDTTSAVRQQGQELHGETYGRRKRQQNVYASLEQAQPFIIRTNLLTLARVTAAAALAITASQSPPYLLCAFLFRVFQEFPWRQAAQSICLATPRFS